MARWILLAVFAMVSAIGYAGESADGADGPIFELRTYTTVEGRLPALQARFRDHTMGLFEKHGIRNVGYWLPVDRQNTLVYIIAHANQEAIATGWRAFGSDPEWRKVAKESQKDGPILIENGIQSEFLTATDFSPIR